MRCCGELSLRRSIARLNAGLNSFFAGFPISVEGKRGATNCVAAYGRAASSFAAGESTRDGCAVGGKASHSRERQVVKEGVSPMRNTILALVAQCRRGLVGLLRTPKPIHSGKTTGALFKGSASGYVHQNAAWYVRPMHALHATIEQFAAEGFTHVECCFPRCHAIRLKPIRWLPRISRVFAVESTR